MNIDRLQPNQITELLKLHETGAVRISAVSFDLHNVFELIKSSMWPAATLDRFIIKTEQHKINRARSIVSSNGSLKGKKFLDFGCGEGHCVTVAAEEAVKAIGYDPYATWDPTDVMFKDWTKVVENGPYDHVLIYDVIDHLDGPDFSIEDWGALKAQWSRNHVPVLSMIKSVLAPNGRIYARFHPHTSRHGAHTYEELNKAYVQLFMTYKEMDDNNIKHTKAFPAIDPLNHYSKIIEKSGLSIIDRQICRNQVPPFFTQHGEITAKLKEVLKTDNIISIMNIDFVDYVLA